MPENTETTATAADLTAFDLDGFLSGVVQPSTVVPVTRDRSAGERITDAMQAVVDAERAVDAAKSGAVEARADGRSTRRRAADADDPDVSEAEQALGDARGALEAAQDEARHTFVFVRVVSLTRKTRAAARDAALDADGKVDIDAYNLHALGEVGEVFAVDPREHPDAVGTRMTALQWDQFTDAIGIGQFDRLVSAITDLTLAEVPVDFSRPASPSPSGAAFSKS